MLIYSEKHLLPTDVNIITIAGREGKGYFYTHRLLYDQAVILDDIYSENPHELIKAVTGGYSSRGDVVTFLRDIPKPLNIFGPFLMLINEPIESIVDMVGAIHVMSMSMNFRGMLKIPFAMRHTNPKFSIGIHEEYKLSWDMFEQRTLPYDAEMLTRMANGTPVQQETVQQVPTVIADPVKAVEQVEEEVELTEEEKNEQALTNSDNLEDALTGLMNLSEDYWDNLLTMPKKTEEEMLAEAAKEKKEADAAKQTANTTAQAAPVAATPEVSVAQIQEDAPPPLDVVGSLLDRA